MGRPYAAAGLRGSRITNRSRSRAFSGTPLPVVGGVAESVSVSAADGSVAPQGRR
ncbi:MAG: hypothetical protein ACLUFV_12045 [Acutalibacteraceae bacterium]